MSDAVHEILQRIQELPEDDRLLLEERLTEIAEAEWKCEAVHARRIARDRGLDQAAIDQAIHDLLRWHAREKKGRKADPSLVVLDTQSVHAAASVPAATTGKDAGNYLGRRVMRGQPGRGWLRMA